MEQTPASQPNYFTRRVQEISETPELNYPHVFNRKYPEISVPEFLTKFDFLEPDRYHDCEDRMYSIGGRVRNIRSCGKKLYFLEFWANGHRLQVLVTIKYYHGDEEMRKTMHRLKVGDIIGVNGFPCRTKAGELSLVAEDIQILTPCLRQLCNASGYNEIKDVEIMHRKRYLDLLINMNSRPRFLNRSKIIKFTRDFFERERFIEVETPVLQNNANGATAKPFKTYHQDLNIDMYLRIAPEINLKKLIVGGFDKVYEIGKQFRNECIDATHNPEFTSLEAYWAFADYNQLMDFTERYVISVTKHIHGKTLIDFQGKTINFDLPYPRIDILDTLKKEITGFPAESTLESPEANRRLIEICLENLVELPEPQTTNKLLNKLIEHFIESKIISPTFVINHPKIMCPLAKQHRDYPERTERFELFINGKEIANAYTELNNPFEQLNRFKMQQSEKDQGDDEIPPVDEEFVKALEFGLPPTAGLGIGIDRLVMFLTNSPRIQQIILFPTTKPE